MTAAVSHNKKSSHGRDSWSFTFYPHSYSSKPTKGKSTASNLREKSKLFPNIYDLQLCSKIISIIPSTRFLGVEIDSNLNFKTHISKICKTLNYILLLFRSARP